MFSQAKEILVSHFTKSFIKVMTVPCIQAAQVDRGERTLRSCGLWAPMTLQNVAIFKLYHIIDPEVGVMLRDVSEEIAKGMGEGVLSCPAQ